MIRINKGIIKTFTFFLLIIFCPFSPSEKFIFGSDKILDYSLGLLKEKKVNVIYDEEGNPISINNGIVDSNYREIAKAYFYLGFKAKGISVIDKLTLEDTRYELLKDLIHSEVGKNQGIRTVIKNQIKKIKNKLYKIYLYTELIISYLEDGKKENACEVFSERNKILKALKHSDIEIYEFAIGHSLSMVFPLIENDLLILSEQLMKDVENYISKQPKFELMRLLLEKYLDLNMMHKIDKLIIKMKKSAKETKKNMLELAVLFLQFERYNETEKLLEKIFKFSENKNHKDKTIPVLEGFAALNDTLEMPMILNIVRNNGKIREVINKNLNERISKRRGTKYNFLNDNTILIKFLIKTGYYQEARDWARKLDKENNTNKYKDYYYYQIGLVYEQSFEIDAMNLIAEKIKMKSMAVELFIRVARYYRKSEEWTKFKKVMNKATKIISKKEINSFIFGDVGDVVITWLDGGFFNEAYETIKYEQNKRSRSLLLFEVAQSYILKNNVDKAEKLIDEINVEDHKALVLSKIASKFMINCKEKKGIEYFKKSINIEILNNGHYLNHILRDYINAIKDKKIIKTNLWEMSKVVH